MKLPDWKMLCWALLALLVLGSAGCSGINANVPVSPAMFLLQNDPRPLPPYAATDWGATPLLANAE
jgi:hypothetical protein